jgi:diguanylate cyclase (GGDEF)-like protein/PAS domain S-box-containing protein
MGGIGPMRKSRTSQKLDIRRFLQYLFNIPVSSLLDDPLDGEQIRRLYILFAISLTGILTLIPFSIFTLIQKNYAFGTLDFVLASILVINLLHARRYRNYNFNVYLGISFTAIFITYAFLIGGINSSGFVWYYAFPLIASFLLGSKKGAIATGLIFLPVVALFLIETPLSILANYSFDFKLRFFSSFFIVFVFSYLFEYLREKSQEELQSAHDELENRVEERTSALQEAIQSLQNEISERRRIEEALRESQDRNRDLVEYSRYLICTHDLKGQILSVNQEGARLLGYDQRDLLKKNIRDFLVPDVRDEFDTYLDTIQKHGNAKGLMLLQTATGEKRIWEYNNTLRTEGVTSPIVRGMAHDVTERIQADKAAKRLAQENAIVAEIGRIITSTLNINEVYKQFSEEVHKVIPFDWIAISMIDHEKSTFHNEYTLKDDVPGRELGKVIPLAGSFTEEVMCKRSIQLIHIEDRDELAVRFPALLPHFQSGIRSFMAVPLISKDKVIGVLHIFSVKSKTYTEADKNLAESIGNQIAGAIANAQLFIERKRAEEALQRSEEEAKRLAQENAIVAEIGKIISSSLNIKEVYEHFAEEVRKLIPFDRIMINLIDLKNNTSTTAYIAGIDVPGRRAGDITPLAGTVTKEVISTRSSLLIQVDNNINNIDEVARRFPSLLPTFQTGLRSLIFVPLISKDQVIGVLSLRSKKLNAYSDQDLRIAENIGNQIAGAIANAQLFTERKEAEEALRKSEERFKEMYDNAPIGYHEYDKEGRMTQVNQTELKILGYTAEEMLGQPVWKFSVEEETSRHTVLAKLAGTIPPGRGFERTYRRKDGTTIPVIIEDRLLRDSKGRILGIRSTIQDITDRRQAEEKLRESEERFRELAENIREVFYIYEQDIQHLSYISPAYMEIWGRTCQSLYKEPSSFLDAVHPEDKDQVKRTLKKRDQGEVEEVYRIVRPDGSIRWIKERSFPIYDGSGKAHRIVGIAADITDLKLGEEKLKYLSLHDPLTKLYNRIYFEEEMSRIEKARYDTVGIVSCDVDGLKLVNDTLGHDHGDNLLLAAANVIRESFREGDLVARIGGDEFSVLLPDTTETAVENACQRIQEGVASYNATNPELHLSISVGYAVSNGVYRNLKDLFKEADNSMYRKKLYHTQSARSTIVKTLINTLKARDLTTDKHVIRLEKLLVSLGVFIGLPASAIPELSLFAKFHDIGKVGISDSILFKKSPLTSEDWTEMKRHCEIGYRIALSASDLVPIADWILKHHEWWNGGGYPLGIKGEEIPIECRLLAIAESYEALTSVRPYRRAFPHAKAMAELFKHSGTQFDPKLLEKFAEMLETHSLELESEAPSAV